MARERRKPVHDRDALQARKRILFAIQLVPYGRDHTNPAGGRPIAWDRARTEQLMADACLDCHSNLTRWPWYSNIAPVSWLVQKDVEDGRHELNLSTGEVEVEEMIETIRDGSMPPWQHKPTHLSAWLSEQEKLDLIRGIEATFGAAGADDGGPEGEGEAEFD